MTLTRGPVEFSTAMREATATTSLRGPESLVGADAIPEKAPTVQRG
jgi:hypothetical protein